MKIETCENLITLWSKRLKIKRPPVIYGQGFRAVAKVDLDRPRIILNILRLPSENILIHACLHELCHLFFESKNLPKVQTIYWKEYYAEKLTLIILKENYPKVYTSIIKSFIQLFKRDADFAASKVGVAYQRAILKV